MVICSFLGKLWKRGLIFLFGLSKPWTDSFSYTDVYEPFEGQNLPILVYRGGDIVSYTDVYGPFELMRDNLTYPITIFACMQWSGKGQGIVMPYIFSLVNYFDCCATFLIPRWWIIPSWEFIFSSHPFVIYGNITPQCAQQNDTVLKIGAYSDFLN